MSGRDDWRRGYEAAPAGPALAPSTSSGIPLEPAYGPDDGEWPGVFPYTRGPYASMYRSKLWTHRMFAGFGSAEESNGRIRALLDAGGDGLSIAFDLPTLMGRDSDDVMATGEVGRCGVAIDTLTDMEALFAGIDLGRVSTSMTINSPAAIVLAMYVVAAEKAGVPRAGLRGTVQNDILKEYQAENEYLFPPRPSVRLVTDVVRFCTAEMPRWHPLSVSGYHIREAGSTAVEELAFTLANGFAYVEAAVATCLAADEFAPRLSFFFNAQIDFFEEIAKFRAARRLWARWLRDRYGATDERSLRCRFHVQTAGASLTAQQPEVNVVRTTLEALAGVLGGAQSMHTNALDEALRLPTADTSRLALRTQQVIAAESGVAHVADPLGGSWLVETLTDEVGARAQEILLRISDMGDGSMLDGVLAGIEWGWFQRRIADSAYEQAGQVERGDRVVVGVNRFTDGSDGNGAVGAVADASPDDGEERQRARLGEVKSARDDEAVATVLARVTADARRPDVNLMPVIIDAVRAYATEGEIVTALGDVFGYWASGEGLPA